MWKMDESMSISVGGDVDDFSKVAGDGSKSHGGGVRRAARGFVVKIPQDYDFFRFGGENSFFGRDHVDFRH